MAISPTTITNAVTAARRAVADLRVTVSHYAYSSQGGDGAPVFATAVERSAIVSHGSRLVRRPDGSEVVASVRLQLLDPVAVTLRDRFTVESLTRQVVAFDTVTNPDTGLPYAVRVDLL